MNVMGLFIAYPALALIPAFGFAALTLRSRSRITTLTAALWVLYAAYEAAMARRILCSGECNIRVDLLLIYAILGALSVTAIVIALRGLRRSGGPRAGDHALPGRSGPGGIAPIPDLTAMATFDEFLKIDIRVGRIVEAREFPEARKPAYQLRIDFGPQIGIKRSSAQIVGRYSIEALTGRLVLAVVNFPPRRIGPFESEVLTLGVPDEHGHVMLVAPDSPDAVLGSRLF